MAPGANPVLIQRYETGRWAGLRMRKLNIISFNYGKYRLNGTVDENNLLERVETHMSKCRPRRCQL